jgi:hypothetical protein
VAVWRRTGRKNKAKKEVRGGFHGAAFLAQPPHQPPSSPRRDRGANREQDTARRGGSFPRRLRPQPHPPHGSHAGWGPRRRRRGPDAGGPAAPRCGRTRPRRRQGERVPPFSAAGVWLRRPGAVAQAYWISPLRPPRRAWWFTGSLV